MVESAHISSNAKHVISTLLCALLLIGVNVFIFSPALTRVLAGDHVFYVAQLNGAHTLSDGLKLCDYNLVREYNKGDEVLYRPLLFAWMALENTLFQNQHFYWNAMNLALHCAIALLLWALLNSIQKSYFAFLFALLFSVLTGQVELVMWNHLGGYIWACVWILCGFFCARKAISETNERPAFWLAGYTLSFAIGVFFYEFCVIVAVLAAIYPGYALWKTNRIPKIWCGIALLLPLVLYAIFYVPHYLKCPRYELGNAEKGMFSNLTATLAWAPGAFMQMLELAALPGAIAWLIKPFYRFEFQLTPWVWSSLAIVPVVLLAAFFFSTSSVRRNGAFLLLLVVSLSAYIFMVCLGRRYAPSYYNYVFDLIMVLAIYCSLDFSKAKVAYASKLFGAALLIFAGVNAYYSNTTSELCYKANFPQHQLYSEIDEIIREHRDEPGFSFDVENVPPTLNPKIGLICGYGDAVKKTEVRPMLQILYANLYDPRQPKYRLIFDPKNFKITPKRVSD